MKLTTASTVAASNILDFPAPETDQTATAAPPRIIPGHGCGAEDEAAWWCGLNELLFAVEFGEIMEISTGSIA